MNTNSNSIHRQPTTLSNFSTSQYMTSFTHLLATTKEEEEEQQQQEEEGGLMNQEKSSSFSNWGMNSYEAANNQHKSNIEIPKYKSFPPASLPISPPPLSPSSYLSFPSTLSPSILLDSPVLFSSSNVSLLPYYLFIR